MIVRIVQVGNSKGLRLPKAVLEQCQFDDEVELKVHEDELIIKPVGKIRKGWDKAFQAMARNHDDQLLDTDTTATEWDKSEWEW